jgi:cobalt-zinc-cadmium efflux system outer membrane protein
LAKVLASLSQRVFDSVAARVKAGKVSPIEKTRAKIAYSTSKIDFERTKRDLEAARKRLAAFWGDRIPLFSEVKGQLEKITSIPSAQQLEDLISQNPNIARWAIEMEQRRANVELEDAKKISNPTISLGGRHFSENDDNAFVLMVSIPIPVFDRNQGATVEAWRRLKKAKEERKTVSLRVLSELAQVYQSLSSAYSEAKVLKQEVLLGAQDVFEASRKGYLQGKFSYLVLLDAQRTLFEVKRQHLEVLRQYHKALADAERLIGTNLNTLAQFTK